MTTAVFLNNDKKMPLLGLGVYKATKENEAENAIIHAVKCGYRLINTASAYKNERRGRKGYCKMRHPQKRSFCHHKNLEQRTAARRYRRSFSAKS